MSVPIPSSLRLNVLSNAAGQCWAALMGLAFIPVYIRVLGVEAYGVVGVFVLMQTWATLLDFGMTPMINREMARHLAGARSRQSAMNLLRSVVVLTAVVAAVLAGGVIASADWIAADWLQPKHHAPAEIARAIAVAGVLLALRVLESPYRGAVLGMQQHLRLNLAIALLATARWGGAAIVISWSFPRLDAFFGWQAVVSVVTVLVLRREVNRCFAAERAAAQFSWVELRSVGRFAGGTTLTACLALILTQSDKLILTRWFSLQTFGYYSAAWTIASALYLVVAPLTQSYYPRFTAMVVARDMNGLHRAYHQAAQLLALCIVPLAFLMIFFGGPVLGLWLGDASLAAKTQTLLAPLMLGILMNGFLHIPHVLALAMGWVRFAVYANAVAVLVFLPILLFATTRHGVFGAAVSWAVLNTGMALVGMFVFHGRLLPSERRAWYLMDVGAPLAVAAVLCGGVRWAVADVMAMPWWMLATVHLVLTLALILVLPELRAVARSLFSKRADG